MDTLDSILSGARWNVRINVLDREKNIIDVIEDHNLIVKLGRSELIKLIVGQSTLGGASATKISKMALGSGGTPVGSPFSPTPPIDSDISLYTPIPGAVNNITATTVDLSGEAPKVTFTGLFDSAVVNSIANELVLLFNDSTTIFARFTFKTISLDSESGLSIQVLWTIQF